jgi:hypothetical protein
MKGSRASGREAVHGFCPPNRYLTLHREPVSEAMTEAVCKATTAAGERCKARPLRGEEFCALHAPGADPRAMGARGGRARGKKEQLEQLTDRESALRALRRALDGNNMAAMVASAKALIEFDHSPRERPVTVEDAREQLEARLNAVEDHRRRNGEVCSACGGSGIVVRPPGRGEGAGIDGGRGASFPERELENRYA